MLVFAYLFVTFQCEIQVSFKLAFHSVGVVNFISDFRLRHKCFLLPVAGTLIVYCKFIEKFPSCKLELYDLFELV